jgi:two-component system, chemotaxis family, sensor kinase CheA
MTDAIDRGREEFLAEAQEIVESFSRALLLIDANFKKGTSDPNLLNESFRAVHTLKGLSGLFGVTALSSMTHQLENLLDALRLGRLEVSAPVLDVLFGAVDASHRILAHHDDAQDPTVLAVVGEVLAAIERVSGQVALRDTGPYEIDPGIIAVLTEYEEHRLQANLKAGMRLYKIRASFDLLTIDKALEALKDRARKLGEVITYLPTGESSSIDTLDLDLLLASGEDLATLIGQLGGDAIVIEEVQRLRSPSSTAAQAGPPSVGLTPLAKSYSHGPLVEEEADRPQRAREQGMARRAVRVDIRKLDHLMNMVGELAILRGNLLRAAQLVKSEHDRQLGGELYRMQRTLERRLEDLQNGILEMRMVPLGQVFDRLARGVRQVSRDLGREVRLVITGSDTEIDKLIVEELGDPLLHMLRNAIDHGIETAEERKTAKKPASGTIALNAYQKGNHVMIEVEDDGRGIDEARLLARAVQIGAVAPDIELSRDEVLALIFLPGLSTRQDVSELSGRGVGMDVVKTNISRIGGVIDVHSERGIGTKLTLTLPITLAIVRALLVKIGGQTFAVPLSAVSEVLELDQMTRRVDGREVMTLRGQTLALCRLRQVFALETSGAVGRSFVVVAQVGERRLGLIVDSIAGQQDIVIKALGPSLRDLRGFAGATELGDERVGLVLDAAAIVEEAFAAGDGRRKGAAYA